MGYIEDCSMACERCGATAWAPGWNELTQRDCYRCAYCGTPKAPKSIYQQDAQQRQQFWATSQCTSDWGGYTT